MLRTLLLFVTLIGAIAMTAEQAPGQEKKEKEFPPLPKGEVVFDEKVTVKRWNAETKNFTSTKEDIDARRWSSKSGDWFTFKSSAVGASKIPPGSEIVDADSNAYEVLENPVSADTKVRVKRKK